jgi:hypothetical protein
MRTAARTRFALAVAALIITSSCGGADLSKRPEEKPSPDAATVEVDLYSGRPNPAWSLTPEEVARLAERVDRLAPAGEVEPPGRLGYRGLRFRLYSRGREIASAESFDGHLRFQDAAGPRHLADPGGEVERWLLQTGRGKIESQVYETLRNEAETYWTRKKGP